MIRDAEGANEDWWELGITVDTVIEAATASSASAVAGSVVLYKAVSTDRVRKHREGDSDINSLEKTRYSLSEFKGYGTILRFTPSIQVANRFRDYIKRRTNTSTTALIQLTLSNIFTKDNPPHHLGFGDV